MKPERVGGVKCFTKLPNWNTTRKDLHVCTTDSLITCSLGMGAAIQKTYDERSVVWTQPPSWRDHDDNKVWSQPSLIVTCYYGRRSLLTDKRYRLSIVTCSYLDFILFRISSIFCPEILVSWRSMIWGLSCLSLAARCLCFPFLFKPLIFHEVKIIN